MPNPSCPRPRARTSVVTKVSSLSAAVPPKPTMVLLTSLRSIDRLLQLEIAQRQAAQHPVGEAAQHPQPGVHLEPTAVPHASNQLSRRPQEECRHELAELRHRRMLAGEQQAVAAEEI